MCFVKDTLNGDNMIIAVDGMGGDNAPVEIVKGAIAASEQIPHRICILGPEEIIEEELKKYSYDKEKIFVRNTTQIIDNCDSPVRAVRSKKDSSMVAGINMLKSDDAQLFISAGNTGALMAGSLIILDRISGIERPAIASSYPILKAKGSKISLMVDSGANSECKARNLLEFAIMGSIYMEKVIGIDNPKVGLVNIGEEEIKGTATIKEAYGLLKESGLNFVGNVEAREIPKGAVDVVVCDGFVGNVILKLTEGFAGQITRLLKDKLTDGVLAKIGAAFLYGKMKDMKKLFDYSEYGGAPILGVRGAVVKTHGSANANAVKNTIIKGIAYAENNVVELIEESAVNLEETVGSID